MIALNASNEMLRQFLIMYMKEPLTDLKDHRRP